MFAAMFRSDSAVPTRLNVVALILRLGLAVIFLYHGLNKITSGDVGAAWVNKMYMQKPALLETKPIASRNPEGVPATLTFTGTQLAVAWGEFLGGIALAIGMLTRLASLGMIIIQVGAVCLVTAPRGFSFAEGGGYEYNVALLVMCLALLILGAGAWSVDGALARRRRKAAGQAAPPAAPLAGPHTAPGLPVEQGVENR